MHVLRVRPGRRPEAVEVGNDLESLQREVGGDIEAVYPWPEPVCLICNEEGKFAGLPLNRALRDDAGRVYDVVAGTFLLAGEAGEELGSLTAEELVRFAAMFAEPEDFYLDGNRIVAVKRAAKKAAGKTKGGKA